MSLAARWDDLAAGAGARSPWCRAAPKPATEVLPLWRTILQLRRNALSTWGEPAYEHDIFSRPFLGRTSFLVNHPDGDPAGAGRQPRQLRPHARPRIRILRPILGDGLFLAEGAAWKHQRRTMAPAFAPAQPRRRRPPHRRRSPRRPWPSSPRAAPGRSTCCASCSALALEVAGRVVLLAGHARARRRRARRLRALRQPARPALLPRLPPAGRGAEPARRRALLARARLQARARPDDRRARGAPPPAGPAARPVRRAGDRARPRDRRRASRPTSCATRSRP